MAKTHDSERALTTCEGVQMTPEQSNEVIEHGLEYLRPALECVHAEMVRLKEDLANGKFDVRKLLARAKEKLQLL